MAFRPAVAALLLAVPVAAQSPRQAQVKAAAEGITAAQLLRDVTELASDANKGRSSPGPGFDSAATYIARALKAAGVKPAGDDGTYFLHYTLIRSTLDTIRTAGQAGSTPLKGNEDFLVTSFRTPGRHQGEVVYVGTGVRSLKAGGDDPYRGLDVKGKWLLVHPIAFGATRTMGDLGVDYSTVQEEAKSRGALGILTIAGAAQQNGWANSRRRVPTVRDLEKVTGRAYSPYSLPQLMLAPTAVRALLGNDAALADRMLAPDSVRGAIAAVALGGNRRLSIDLAAVTDTVRPYNVMGLVEGSDPRRRDEWIAVVSHLDGAVGRGVTADGDSIYNAADDNATGSSGNISIARAFMRGPRPARSILLVWDSGEETGLWGSRFLAYGPIADRFVAQINVDMIGRTRRADVATDAEVAPAGEVYVVGPGHLSTVMEKVLASAETQFPFVKPNRSFDRVEHEYFYPRSDASPYLERGIPVMQFFTGSHGEYHRQTDDVAKLDPVKMEQISRFVYSTVWLLADGADRPRFDKPVPNKLWFVTPRK